MMSDDVHRMDILDKFVNIKSYMLYVFYCTSYSYKKSKIVFRVVGQVLSSTEY